MKKTVACIMMFLLICCTGCGIDYKPEMPDSLYELCKDIEYGNYYNADDFDYNLEESDEWTDLYMYFEEHDLDEISFEEAYESFVRLDEKMHEMHENGIELLEDVEEIYQLYK